MNSSTHLMDAAEQTTYRATNQVLAALPADDRRRIEPHLARVELSPGAMLHEAGGVLRHVYFPVTAIVSLVSTMQDGASTEVAVVGKEGFVGVDALLGARRALSDAVVQSAGHAFRMNAESIASHAWQSEPVMQRLLRYTATLFRHMAQASACNRHHALDQKLCRWLLLSLDRRDGDEIVVTHEQLAGMLGVRREGVTGSALKLQRAGLIQCRRGHMSVVDRAGIEARSCECYSVLRQAYDRLWAGSATESHGWSHARRHQSDGVGRWAATA